MWKCYLEILWFLSCNKSIYIYIYIKAETSCESIWGAAMWHSNIAFSLFYLFLLRFLYYYPIDHSNLFLLLYKFSIFYLFLLSIFYCYPIDHSNLFLLLYKFSIFYLFLLSIFYFYPIDHSNFFLLLYQIWVVLDN